MFGAKSGFVIPRNKLSGSLVPVFRGGKKPGGSDAANDESTKQVQRKTKWGPDSTQDATVRRGRALAYQTRVDQITQQLKSGILEIGDNQDVTLAAQVVDHEHFSNDEKLKLLELERRELIGELLKLSPTYKAPPDYKPVLKEARVPIPVKEYPGYNFIGLICGPGGDTVKRLEKETGAKVQIYGAKAVTGEKRKISPSDVNETHVTYEELYIHLSADSFERVDAAVALIELLMTPIAGTPAAVSTTSTSIPTDAVSVPNQIQDSASPYTIPAVAASQGVVQSVTRLEQNLSQGQFQLHSGPWISMGPQHTPLLPYSGFIPLPTSSAPIFNSATHLPSQPFNSLARPSLGLPPAPSASFGFILPNQSLVPPRLQQPMQGLQHQYLQLAGPGPLSHTGPPSNPSISGPPQPPPVQANAPGVFTSSQPTASGFPSTPRLLMPSLPPFMPRIPQEMPQVSVGSSCVMQRPPLFQPQGSHHVAPQSIVAPRALPNNSAAYMVPPSPFQLCGPQSSSSSVSQPVAAPMSSASLLPKPLPVLPPAPAQIHAALPVIPMPVPLPVASSPIQSGISASDSGTLPRFTPLKPPSVAAPKPQHTSSGDFTFQPLRAQTPVYQGVLRASDQSATQITVLKPTGQPPLVPQAPSFRPAMPTSGPQSILQAFPRPQVCNQIGQPQAQVSPVPFAGNPNAISVRPRLPSFPVMPSAPVPQLGVRNSSLSPQMPNASGPFLLKPGNPGQFQQNYSPVAVVWPENTMAPNQQLSNNPSFASGKPASGSSLGQHVYDPFSPTSVPQQGGDLSNARKQESDPEYEDLMASVGVS